MKIIFYHHTPLPVKTYGGTERIMFWHMKELAKLRHEVVLLGHPDSQVEEFGIKLIKLSNDNIRNGWEKLIPLDADIVHLQVNKTLEQNIPQINTVHGNGQPEEVFHINSVFVSNAHANLHGSERFIYNALDFDEYPKPESVNKSNQNLLFLAKASWSVKNLKDSKAVAIANKKHLYIAGGRTFSLSRYIHNIGQIGGEEKIKLIRNCDALIFPVRWPEPFGLALVEAMSQGLGIFGSCYGSLPEVIGEAGYICKNKFDLNEAVQEFKFKLTPNQIIDYAHSTFNIGKYTQDYLCLYEKVINNESLNKKNPVYTKKIKAEELLDF